MGYCGRGDPVKMLQTYPKRISMLHVKDFNLADKNEKGEPKVEELGLGTVDSNQSLRRLEDGNIEHIFVEQEAFNVPPMQSLKMTPTSCIKSAQPETNAPLSIESGAFLQT